jgi:hypothetical protein
MVGIGGTVPNGTLHLKPEVAIMPGKILFFALDL